MATIVFFLLPLVLVGVVCCWELPLLSQALERRLAAGGLDLGDPDKTLDTEREPDLALVVKRAEVEQPVPPAAELLEMVCEDEELIRMASKPQFVEDEEMLVTKRKDRVFTRRRRLSQATLLAWEKADTTYKRPC